MAIKAGWYKFNGVLTAPSQDLSVNIPFKIHVELSASVGMDEYTCSEMKVMADGEVRYVLTEGNIGSAESDVEFPYELTAYKDGWRTEYGYVDTIEVQADTEVSDEFVEWFAISTNPTDEPDTPDTPDTPDIPDVPDVPDVPDTTKVIKAGTYRFNDVLSEVETSNIVTMNFSMKTYIPALQVEVVADCSGMQLDATAQGGLDFNYVVESFSENLGVLFPYKMIVYSARNGYGWYHGEFGTGIQTITIPNDITVSSEFYAWFTANTKRLSTRLSTIAYNGSTIASLLGGQKATLKCSGMKMESDVVVEVAEQTESAVGLVDVRIEEV